MSLTFFPFTKNTRGRSVAISVPATVNYKHKLTSKYLLRVINLGFYVIMTSVISALEGDSLLFRIVLSLSVYNFEDLFF